MSSFSKSNSRKRKKYILHPGRRQSDNKTINARVLAQLYDVDEKECVTAGYVAAHPNTDFWGFKHLYIREDDNYRLKSNW